MRLSELPLSKMALAINEVKMSPKRLVKKAMLNKYGIQVGFESEFVIPNGLSDYGGSIFSELASRPIYSLDDVAEILDDAADSNITSQSVARNQYRSLRDSYYEFISEWQKDQFEEYALEKVIEVLFDQVYDREEEIKKKLSEMGLDEDEVEESYNDEDRNYVQAVEALEEEITLEASSSIRNKDEYYQDAFNNFIDELDEYPSEEDFLESEGIEDGATLLSYIGVDDDETGDNYDMSAVETMADSYANFMSIPRNEVNVHDHYHQTSKDYQEWYFEPDSSIESDSSDDLHIEVVSPVMPIDEALEAIKDHFAWLKSVNAVTNESTGLHIGVSFTDSYKNESVDLLKLAIFAGDDKVLSQFGRKANGYCESYFNKIRSYKDMTEEDIPELLEKLKGDLSELSERTIKNAPKNRYQSINPKGDYIEFRSIGNKDYHNKLDEIQASVGRFAYAYAIAGDPNANREEYLKKLYKFLNPAKGTDLDIFVRFAAGDLTNAEVKREWASAILPRESDHIFSDYSIVDKQTNKIVGYVHADSQESAITQAMKKVNTDNSKGVEKFEKRYTVEPVDERRKLKSKMNVDPSTPLDRGNDVNWIVSSLFSGSDIDVITAKSEQDAVRKWAEISNVPVSSVKSNYKFTRQQGDMFANQEPNKRQHLAKKVGQMKSIIWQVYKLPDMENTVLELEADRNSEYGARRMAMQKMGISDNEWRSGRYIIVPKLR